MGRLHWYKRDPEAALAGMMELSLEERGAYNTVLDLIYTRDGAIDDDERFISGWLRCDVRVWKRIRARLIGLGKLYIKDGSLRNERADAEVDRALHRVVSASDAGKASARKRCDVTRENNDLGPTVVVGDVEPYASNSTYLPSSEDLFLEKERKEEVIARTRGKRCATRIPADWKLSPAGFAYAAKWMPAERIPREAENFHDHWLAIRDGPKAEKRDWEAAWRTWCRRAEEFSRASGNGQVINGSFGGARKGQGRSLHIIAREKAAIAFGET